jgi:Cu-Zn family superoxide dismutase
MPSLAYRLLVALSLTAFAVAALADDDGPKAHATLIGIDGQEVGQASFTQGPTGVLILVQLHGLPTGPHGTHLHAVGSCEAAGGFESAGPHIGADHAKHGLLANDGPHAGDLPSVDVDATGEANVEFLTATLSVLPGDSDHALLDDDASAIVVHENADDQTTQPGGGTGKRIACGVIDAAD